MLRDLLREIAAADGAVRPAELARRLGVERSAVDGMIGELVRLGRLGAERSDAGCPFGAMARGSCGRSCGGIEECPLVARMPPSFGVVRAGHEVTESSPRPAPLAAKVGVRRRSTA